MASPQQGADTSSAVARRCHKQHRKHPVISDILDVGNYCGIDEEGPFPELQTNNNVIIPDIDVTFNDTTMNIIRQVNQLENDGNHGIDVFILFCHYFSE